MRRTVAPGMRRIALQTLQLMLLALLLLIDARAQSSVLPDPETAEAKIKAAFICKFGNYIEWPAGAHKAADSAFVIGAMTSDAVVAELTRAAAGRTVNGRPIVVRKLMPGDHVDDLAIAYVSHTHSAALPELLAAIGGRPILTITESDAESAAGSMVNFVVVDDRVRFDIALQPAEHSSLRISGRLLALARKVTGAPS